MPDSLLRLMREDNFPRVWVPSPREPGSATTSVAPASAGADAHADHESAVALSDERGRSLEEKLFSERGRAEFEKLPLGFFEASRRRQELLELLDRMNPTIEKLTAAVEQEARKRPEVLRLMTHPRRRPAYGTSPMY